MEEYSALQALGCFQVISETGYKTLTKLFGPAIPSMAISCIKMDKFGNPKRAKYRIVALGNHEERDWTKQDCYAPVTNLLEVRTLTGPYSA